MLLKLAYLSVTNMFAMLRLLPVSTQDKDVEILALRHQITVLQRHLNGRRVQFAPGGRAFLAALLHDLPKEALLRMRLLVRPDTILRWHRDLVARRHAARSRPHRGGRLRTVGRVRRPTSTAPSPLCAVGCTCRMRRTRNHCAADRAMSDAAAAQPRLRILRVPPGKRRGRPDHEPDHASPVRMLPDRDQWSGAVAASLVGGAG
ncbi:MULTISPECIES: hypothetical protein [Streptomyces]|uniref:hypothetical protein n=1 Tax=Streptomyces TaxID=1883 RepID=UPI002252F2ED|nr:MULTISPECIES: hypothetical protein [Streptomyces]MCX4431589.1 hypothetical protein [Streptomyces mirabilis]